MKARKSILSNDLILNYDKKDCAVYFPTFHYHNAYEIYILTHGSRKVIINDMIYHTSDYDAVMIKPGTFHRSYGDIPYMGICLNFSDAYLDRYFTETSKKQLLECFSKPVITLDITSTDEIERLAKKILDNPNRKFIYLFYILDILNDFAKMEDMKYKLETNSELTPIMKYISENFTEIKCLEDVAKEFYISKNYLCSLFKKQTGMTISYYINSLRIKNACGRLSETKDSIYNISIQVGFESTAYFNRVFKKYMNCTPSEFRQKTWYKPEDYR